MIGYKGIELRRGILRAKSNGEESGDIFEIHILKHHKLSLIGRLRQKK